MFISSGQQAGTAGAAVANRYEISTTSVLHRAPSYAIFEQSRQAR
jgi:hypothetical protein